MCIQRSTHAQSPQLLRLHTLKLVHHHLPLLLEFFIGILGGAGVSHHSREIVFVGERFDAAEYLEDVARIHDRYQRVQRGIVEQRILLLGCHAQCAIGNGISFRWRIRCIRRHRSRLHAIDVHRESLRDREGFADARRFDDEVIEFVIGAEGLDGLEEVAAEGAADASVVHFDHFGVFLDYLRLFDFVGVEIDFSHIIDNDCHLEFITTLALIVQSKNAFEQSRLASAKKSR
mmetsp:Transcript_11510/g.24579  ORF Transcript_11510/g.24579 Transcript_11510/m.24579 type:complete len:232 (+) Transcript_11510:569-1264(+)